MKVLIEKIFNKTIHETFNKENHEIVRNFLLNHPLRHVMFDNLEREIKDAGVVLDGMIDHEKKKESISILVASLTKMFAHTALNVKEKEIRSIYALEERIQSEDSE